MTDRNKTQPTRQESDKPRAGFLHENPECEAEFEEELAALSPEGRPPGRPLSALATLLLAVSPVLLGLIGGLVVGFIVDPLAGVFAAVLIGGVGTVMNPVFWASINRARERREAHDHVQERHAAEAGRSS
ncbi:MAG: hypothetical protein VYC34_04560 [Planctomycetota bacterium]|nr:hypothetical protein [Planctomycetota bacterium]